MAGRLTRGLLSDPDAQGQQQSSGGTRTVQEPGDPRSWPLGTQAPGSQFWRLDWTWPFEPPLHG